MGLAEGDDVEVMAAGDRVITLARMEEAEGFLAQLRALQRPAPPGFRWSRKEANERGHADQEE